MKEKCKHQAGWWTDVLMWGDADGIYLANSPRVGRRSRRGKILMKCNMQGCNATRNVYVTVPIPVTLGRVGRTTK